MSKKHSFDDTFIVKLGWMNTKLNLKKSNQVDAFALVWGFCQDRQNEFTGSISFVSKWCKCSRTTTIKIMDDLVQQGLLYKRQEILNGVTFNRYSPNFERVEYLKTLTEPEPKKNCTGSKETAPPSRKTVRGGSQKTVPNITINNINTLNSNIDKKEILLFSAEEKETSNRPNSKKEKSSAKKEKAKIQTQRVLNAVAAIELLNSLLGLQKGFSTATEGAGSKNVVYVSQLLAKGCTLEQIENMIIFKVWQWKDNPTMKQHLKPVTIFKRHGLRYIEEANMAKDDPQFLKVVKAAKTAEKNKNGVDLTATAGATTQGVLNTLKNW